MKYQEEKRYKAILEQFTNLRQKFGEIYNIIKALPAVKTQLDEMQTKINEIYNKVMNP